MYKSIQAIKIKTSIVFNLVLANNTILLCSFVFFLMIDLYIAILVVIAKVFNPTRELITLRIIPTNEVKSEIEIKSLREETKIRKCLK